MKKFIAVVITVIMLMSVCGMQSFAFTVKLPTVESVKFIDDVAVSKQDIETSKAMIEELIDEMLAEFEEEYGELQFDLESIIDMLGYDSVEELYNYGFFGTDYGYKLEAVLSDGSVYEIDLSEGYAEIDRYTYIDVEAEVKYADYLAAVEAGEDTVPVVISCDVVSDISGIRKNTEFILEKETVDCFVKSIAPVTALDKTYYEESEMPNLENESFVVTFADSSQKIYKAKFDPEIGEFVLDDGTLNSVIFMDRAIIGYYDAVYEYDITYVDSPYESIEITDYAFDTTDGLTSVTYEIVETNGKSKSFTVDTTAYLKDSLYPSYTVVGFYDSMLVWVGCDEIIDWESNNLDVQGMELYASVGYLYSDSVELEYVEPVEEEKDILTVIEDIIAAILTKIFSVFSFIGFMFEPEMI